MNYEDMMHLNRPQSYYKKMTMEQRAAQFAPFAALNGHEQAILEKQRLTDLDIEMSVDQKQELDYILSKLMANKSKISVHYFVLDDKKEGGSIHQYEGMIKKVDQIEKAIVFIDGTTILIDQIRQISEVE